MNLLLSSPSLEHIVSGGEAESFQKIHCQKFERPQGQPRSGENSKLHCMAVHHTHYLHALHDFENKEFSLGERFLAVLGPQNPLGSCAARNVQNFGGAT